MFLGTGFASETDLFPAGPIPAMEMFMPEPDLEDSLLEPDETTENDEVTIQATMPEPTVTPNSSTKSKDASSSSKKHKITQQDVQSMQIDMLRMENTKLSWKWRIWSCKTRSCNWRYRNYKPETSHYQLVSINFLHSWL